MLRQEAVADKAYLGPNHICCPLAVGTTPCPPESPLALPRGAPSFAPRSLPYAMVLAPSVSEAQNLNVLASFSQCSPTPISSYLTPGSSTYTAPSCVSRAITLIVSPVMKTDEMLRLLHRLAVHSN